MDAKRRYDENRQEREKLIPEVLKGSESARFRYFELESELKELINGMLKKCKPSKKTKS